MSGSEQDRIANPKNFSLDTRQSAWNAGCAANLANRSLASSPWKDESVAGKDWRDGHCGSPFGAWEDAAGGRAA